MYLRVLFVVILAVTLAAAACRSDSSNTQPTTPEKVQPVGDETKESGGVESTGAAQSVKPDESSEPGDQDPAAAVPDTEDTDKVKESSEAKKPTDEAKPKKQAGAASEK